MRPAALEPHFETLHLGNEWLECRVIPELGGKISSLKDRRSGREWLWRSQHLDYARWPYGTSYIAKADTGGWDECFPTVAASPDPHRSIHWPDHGELWSQPWSHQLWQEGGETRLQMEAGGVQHPYRFVRTLVLGKEAELELHYQLHNLSPTPLDFIWSSHPLVALEPGMRLELPPSSRFHLFYQPPGSQTHDAAPFAWPPKASVEGRPIALEPIPSPCGLAFKIWSEPLSQGWAVLRASDGALRLEFDPTEIPQLGLWLNLGGWSGVGGEPYYNLALEACIGAQDSLYEAVRVYRQYRTLEPLAQRSWKLKVRLEA